MLYLNTISLYQPVVVAELLQWTESQVRARGLWTMPAPPERARTPAHNPVPVKRDIPKQLTVLVEVCNVLYYTCAYYIFCTTACP